MQEPENLNQLIRDEDLRRRIRKLIEEPKRSFLEQMGTHPITLLVVGFALTWGVGDQLTNHFNKQELETQKRLEQIKTKQESGLAAVTKISELMYERYATASFLASALKRNGDIEEIKQRKQRYDDAYMKWNTQLQTTQLIVRGLTSDSTYSNMEAFIQYGLRPHYNNLDLYLTQGYDSRLKAKSWDYKTTPIRSELNRCLDCCYAISNYLWIRSNLYGSEKTSLAFLRKADKELVQRCPKQSFDQPVSQPRESSNATSENESDQDDNSINQP